MEKPDFSVPPTLLIVDDSALNLKNITDMLRDQHYNIITAGSGKQALDIIEDHPPELILLDVIMPEMDGWEVCKILKANPVTRDIPVIFLTALADIEEITRGFELGAVDYVLKPCKAAELLARINTHLTLKYSREQLLIMNAYKDKLFSIIAHDLRNPFTTLLGNTSTLYRSGECFSEGDKRLMIKDLFHASKRIYDLLENLLDWALAQINGIQYHPALYGLSELVEDTFKLLQANAQNKNIQLLFDIPSGLQVTVDKEMLKTILRNFVTNAIKFTPEQGHIKVTAVSQLPWVEIRVTDTGVGMSKDLIDKLFKLNQHITQPGTKNEKGSGLGLLLCQDFINHHGGHIRVESEPGKGTCFIFTVPA